MENPKGGLLSRFSHPPASGVRIIQTDGQVIHAEDASIRLNRLINQALGRKRMALRIVGEAPVEIRQQDAPELPDEIREALNFARRAS